jgi:hypothetical protein
MVTFGAPNMSTLYITSGRIEVSLNRPVSSLGGAIFAVETSFRGIPEAKLARNCRRIGAATGQVRRNSAADDGHLPAARAKPMMHVAY